MQKFIFGAAIIAPLLFVSLASAATVIPVAEDVMASSFFTGTDLIRGYSGDSRAVHRVSTENPFGTTGAETIYLTFDYDFTALTGPVASATLSVTSESGGFGGDATPGMPFLVSAHGVTADPLATITDDTNPGGPVGWADFYANNILAAPSAAHTSVTGFGTIDFDVTELVNTWIDGTNTVHAIALTGKGDVSGNEFLHGFTNNSESVGVAHSLSISSVPEPSSWLLMALGGMSLVFWGSTRSRRNAAVGQ